MKLVRSARPISGDSGLRDLKNMVICGDFEQLHDIEMGSYSKVNIMNEYVQQLLSYINSSTYVLSGCC